MLPSALAAGAWTSAYHAPVMVEQVIELLGALREVLDGTLGGGGHTAALLDAGARVTAIDRDPAALEAVRARLPLAIADGRLRLMHANYSRLDRLPELEHMTFDGILLDLGVSSHQLDEVDRGFTFREGAPLDMRMGDDAEQGADTLLNEADERELARWFREFGDEPRAGRLAREVVRRRANRPFLISDDFVGAIRGALGPRTGAGDFARLFQALRIAVNDELAGLARALPVLRDRLAPGGRIVVLSYHSGEDRLVKLAFREWSTDCICPPRHPVCGCGHVALGALVGRKGRAAAPHEAAANPRARSARLRAWQRAA